MPILNMWLVKQENLVEKIMFDLLDDIEKLSVIKDIPEEENYDKLVISIENTEILVKKLNILKSQLPYLVYSVVNSCPYEEKISKDSEPVLHLNLKAIFGDTFDQKFCSFDAFTSQDWFKPWKEYETLNTFLARFSAFLSVAPMHNTTLLMSSSELLSYLIDLWGPNFAQRKILPFFESKISATNCIMPALIVALALQEDLTFKSHSMALLKTWTTHLCETRVPYEPVHQSISLLCMVQEHSLLVDTLRELVASPLPALRAETAHLLNLVISPTISSDDTLSGMQELISRKLLPAMVSLASDPEDEVKLAALPGLADLVLLDFLQWEEKEKVCTQMATLCDDPQDKLVIMTVQQFGRLLLKSSQDIRHQLLLPILCSAPSRSLEICSAIANSLSVIPELHEPESIVSGFILPTLANLLEKVSSESPELEASILSIMAEVEARRRIVGKEGRRASTNSSSSDHMAGLGSPSTPSSSEKVKEKVNKLFHKPTSVPFWKK